MRKPNKQKPKIPPRLLLVLSDEHCGSDVGLLPPEVIMDDGQTVGYGKNPWQKWLWESWTQMEKWVKDVANGDPYDLLNNGDWTEGAHHGSDEMVAAKMTEHIAIACTAMATLAGEASTVYATRGTQCHVKDHLETYIMKTLGYEKAHDFIQMEFHGVLLDARHHLPTTGRLHLESSALSIVAANNRSNAVRAGHEPARIFLRGHRHVPGYYSDGCSLIAVTGGWQGLTRHGKKCVTDSIPRPSAIILDARNSAHGELPTIHQKVFNPPQHLVSHMIQ